MPGTVADLMVPMLKALSLRRLCCVPGDSTGSTRPGAGDQGSGSRKGSVMSAQDSVEGEVRGWYSAYFDTFVSLATGERVELESLLDFYGVPMTVVSDGGYRVLPTREAVLGFARDAIDPLLRAGYAGTQLLRLDIRPLDSYAAFIEGLFSRRDRHGKEIDHAGAAYLAVKTGMGWRVASFVLRTAGPPEHAPSEGVG